MVQCTRTTYSIHCLAAVACFLLLAAVASEEDNKQQTAAQQEEEERIMKATLDNARKQPKRKVDLLLRFSAFFVTNFSDFFVLLSSFLSYFASTKQLKDETTAAGIRQRTAAVLSHFRGGSVAGALSASPFLSAA